MSGDIRAAIRARAQAHAGLYGLIGGSTNPRLYLMIAPQGSVTPYVTFQIISAVREHVMIADSLGTPRVQFDCWGSDQEDALTVRDQVLACYDRFSGTFASTIVGSSVCVNDGMDVQPDDTTLIPRITLEFEMSFRLN